jgi:hypothetical protein
MNNLEPTVPRSGTSILDTPGELGPELGQTDPAMDRAYGPRFVPPGPRPSAPPPTPPSAPGYDFVDDHWERTDGPQHAGPTGGVVTHDHSNSNPSTWTCEEWKAALKRDPEKYTRLYMDLSTKDGGLSEDVTTHKAEMGNIVSSALQDFNRDMTLLKSILDANHETQKALAQFRV